MEKLLRSLVVVVLLSLLVSSRAHAAWIILSVGPDGDLVVDNQTSLSVGGVTILTTGAAAFTFNAGLPGLSLAESVFAFDIGVPPYSALLAYNTVNGVSLVPASSQALLGTFQIPNPDAFAIFSGDDILGGTIFDPFLNPLQPISVHSVRVGCDDPGLPCPLHYYFEMEFVPEPAGGSLAALGLLGLAALVSTRGLRRASSSRG